MKKVSFGFFLVLVCAVVAVPSVDAGSRDEVPLRIVGKASDDFVSAWDKLGGSETNITLTLRNDSEKIITAWKVSCLHAENDGNFAVASVQSDAFLEVESDAFLEYGNPATGRLDQGGLIHPGALRKFVFPRRDSPITPYAAMSCGVDAVIFADGSHAGVSAVVQRFFESREDLAIDALKAIELVSRIKDGQSTAEEILKENSYGNLVRNAERWSREGRSDRLDGILATLHTQVEMIAKHLPPEWGRNDTQGDFDSGADR